MNNNFCQHLKFNFELNLNVFKSIKKSILYNRNLSKNFMWKVPPIFNLDKNLTNFLYSYNITLNQVEIFYTAPFSKLDIHADGPVLDNHSKINYNIYNTESKMYWWDPKENTYIVEKINELGGKYFSGDEKYFNLVHSSDILSPSLVNVGKFHSIENFSDQGRWCLSLVLYDSLSKKNIQFRDALEIFKDYI